MTISPVLHQQSQRVPVQMSAQGTRNQLIVQLCNDVTSLNFKLEEIRDEYQALLKAKEELIKLLLAQVKKNGCLCYLCCLLCMCIIIIAC